MDLYMQTIDSWCFTDEQWADIVKARRLSGYKSVYTYLSHEYEIEDVAMRIWHFSNREKYVEFCLKWL